MQYAPTHWDFMFSRHSIRLPGYDYAQEGWYYVTICTRQREKIFGTIENDTVTQNDLGRATDEIWRMTAIVRPNVYLDEYVIMPNHVHGIIHIDRGHERANAQGVCNTPLRSPSQTVGAIVRGFKSAVTARYNRISNASQQPIWQRNYYEHVIRDADDLERIREYIKNNPKNWRNDTLA